MKKFEVTPVLKKYATIVLDIKCDGMYFQLRLLYYWFKVFAFMQRYFYRFTKRKPVIINISIGMDNDSST